MQISKLFCNGYVGRENSNVKFLAMSSRASGDHCTLTSIVTNMVTKITHWRELSRMWWQKLHIDVSCHECDDKNYTLTWAVTNVVQKLHIDVSCHECGDKHYTLTWVVTNVVTKSTHWRVLSQIWWQKLHTDLSCQECGDTYYTLTSVVTNVMTRITH